MFNTFVVCVLIVMIVIFLRVEDHVNKTIFLLTTKSFHVAERAHTFVTCYSENECGRGAGLVRGRLGGQSSGCKRSLQNSDKFCG